MDLQLALLHQKGTLQSEIQIEIPPKRTQHSVSEIKVLKQHLMDYRERKGNKIFQYIYMVKKYPVIISG